MKRLSWFVLAGGLLLALVAAACASQAGGPQPLAGGGDERQEGEMAIMEASGLAALSSDNAAGDVAVGEAEAPASSAGGGSGGAGGQPSLEERKITRNAELEITVADVQDSMQAVEDIAIQAGGFVSSSRLTVSAGDDGEDVETATMRIRVPAAAYTDVLDKLRGIAKEVRAMTEDAQEVTEEYTDLQSRLRNLQATEQRYLELLGRAETIPDILSLQDRLSAVRGEIEQVQGRINVLNDLTDLATISIKLLPPEAPPAVEEEPGWAEEAWDKSWDASRDVLVVVGSIAIATVVFLPWFVVPAFIGLVVWRLLGRRMTEMADRVTGQGGPS